MVATISPSSLESLSGINIQRQEANFFFTTKSINTFVYAPEVSGGCLHKAIMSNNGYT